MGHLDEVYKNLLRISQGDVSLYERATLSFEESIRPSGNATRIVENNESHDNREMGKTSQHHY